MSSTSRRRLTPHRLLTAAALTVAAGLLLPARVAAQPEEPAGGSEASSQGYCAYVKGVAASESVLLWSPELFGSIGFMEQRLDLVDTPEATVGRDDLRVTAGLRYRWSGLVQGSALRRRAEAECRRQRALGTIRDRIANRENAARRAALMARARFLAQALPQARTIVRETITAVERGEATAPELNAVRLRADDIRAKAAETELALAELGDTGTDGHAIPRALEEFYAADAAVQRADARVRGAQAWDLSVRVGYDRFLEQDDSLPLFAVVSLSYNLGALWQGGAEQRAAAGRRAFAAEEGRRFREQLGLESARLRAVQDAQRRRQEQTAALLVDLEEQLKSIQQMPGDAARRYRRTLWFDWVSLKAEDEYLRAHLDALASSLADSPNP